MDWFTAIFVIAGIGYSIFQEHAKSLQNEKSTDYIATASAKTHWKTDELTTIEPQEKKTKKIFKTAYDCFKEQYVSYSRIATYNSCPHRFKLIYLDRVRPVETTNLRIFAKGKKFHSAVYTYLLSYVGQKVPDLDYKQIVYWAFRFHYLRNSEWNWSTKQKEIEKRKRKIFRANAKFFCNTFPKDTKIVAIEHPLSFELNKIKFYGIPDLVLRYPDGCMEIVDYKTGSRLPFKEQLELYSIPFIQENNLSSIKFRIICVDRESHYCWAQNKKEMLDSTQNILGFVDTIINDKNFVPIINSRCQSCSVNHACKYSENYTKKVSKSKPNANNKLTRLTKAYECKQGVEPPKKKHQKNKGPKTASGGVGNVGKITNPLSYSYKRAGKPYYCILTRKVIYQGEYHFAKKGWNRVSVKAFSELYPIISKQIITKSVKRVGR